MTISEGKLFELRLTRSMSARQDAIDSVRELQNGQAEARIGGRMKGKTILFASRKAALAAIAEHYNRELFRTIREDNARRSRVTEALDELHSET